MAQSTILAAGSTQADSTTIALASGAKAVISIWPSSGELPKVDRLAAVMMATGGADVPIKYLGGAKPEDCYMVVEGPLTEVFVRRYATGHIIGASKDIA